MSAGRKGDLRGKIFLDMDGFTDQLAGQDGGKKRWKRERKLLIRAA